MQDSFADMARIAEQRGEAFTVAPGRADAGLVILCDHAGNELPEEYGTLGLPQAQLERHIGYDIGAAAVTRQLASDLDVPAVLTRYSRLLIDPNRGDDDPTLIMRLSDGAIVPGNRNVDAGERARRISRYHRPYHDAIALVLDQCAARGPAPAILSIHSFTESWKGKSRPWHAGIPRDEDPLFAPALLDALHAENDLIVGDDEPYAGWLVGDTLWRHGRQRGLARTLLEIRQDLIRDGAGQAAWSNRLARLLRSLPQLPYL